MKERYSQERSARNGTYLGRGGGGSSQQTRMASECGPIRSCGRGMNQVKSSQVYEVCCYFCWQVSVTGVCVGVGVPTGLESANTTTSLSSRSSFKHSLY